MSVCLYMFVCRGHICDRLDKVTVTVSVAGIGVYVLCMCANVYELLGYQSIDHWSNQMFNIQQIETCSLFTLQGLSGI